MLSFTIHDLGDVAVFECAGRITAEDGEILRKAVLNQPHAPEVILDLKEIRDVDAAGLGVLVTLRTWSKANGTELKLMNLMPRVEKALDLTGLRQQFAVCSAIEMLGLLCRAHWQAEQHGDLKRAAGF